MPKKKKMNKKQRNLKIISILVLIIGIASIGAMLLRPSKAATTFQPLEVGSTVAAGWSDGLHTDADNRIIIDKLAAAGVKRVRIDIGWSTIEESGDIYGGSSDPTATYNPSAPLTHWYIKKIDNAVNYANSKGIKVLGIWWTTPPWARDAGSINDYQVRPGGYPNYPEYAESIEWATKYWQGRIDDWEVWNEADPSQKFWQSPSGAYGGTAEYAALLKIAYGAAKKGNPNAKVVTSGPASVDDAWISQLYTYGIKGYFDVMAVHAYEGQADNDPLNSDGSKIWNFLHIPSVRQLMVNNGDSDKPIWITEMGWSSHDNTNPTTTKPWNFGVTQENQGNYLVKAIQYAKDNWPYVEVLINYTDKNRVSAGGDAETSRHQMNFGLLNSDNSDKLAYTILKNYLTSSNPPTTYPDADANFTNTSASQVFSMQNPPVAEASGIASTQGLYLTFNDSGGTATVYAYNKSSQLIATINVPGATNADWEDITVVPNGTTDDIYIGDIGDNSNIRTNLKLYKFNIPSINKTILNQSVQAQNVTTYPISYNDGPRDAESLAVSPVTKRAYIVSKKSTPFVYEGPATLVAGSNNVFTQKNAVPLQYSTGADFSKDGKYFVNANGGKAYVWRVTNNDLLASITASPNGTTSFTPPLLDQLEGVTFSPDAKHIVFNTEYGANTPIWAVPNPSYSSTAPLQADLNSDNKVNIQDLSILISKWATNTQTADINTDGVVNIQDLSILISRWTG